LDSQSGGGVLDQFKILQAAAKQAPFLKYAIALVGIAAAASLILNLLHSWRVAVFAIVAVSIGMVALFLVFRKRPEDRNAEITDGPAQALAWLVVVVVGVTTALLISAATFQWPTSIYDALFAKPEPSDPRPSSALAAEVKAILVNNIQTKPFDPCVFEKTSCAQAFAFQYLPALCCRAHGHAPQGVCDGYIPGVAICADEVRVATVQVSSIPLTIDNSHAPTFGGAIPASCQGKALARAPIGTKILGVVVTHHNRNVDWEALKSSGVFFVFIKASQGTAFVDPQFRENWDAAGRAGMIRGAFHFLSGDAPGELQASNFLLKISEVQIEACDLAPALDFEQDTTNTSSARIEDARSWLEVVQSATGRVPILSGGAYLLSFDAVSREDLRQFPLWLAAYVNGPPAAPKPWSRYLLWEFTDGAHGPAIPGIEFETMSFSGSREDFFKLTQQRWSH
jgi:lysozyme